MGQISVRRAQMKLLEAGNATMGVWLGKQLLGKRDVTPIELTGANGSGLKFSLEAIDAIIAAAKKGARRGRDPPGSGALRSSSIELSVVVEAAGNSSVC